MARESVQKNLPAPAFRMSEADIETVARRIAGILRENGTGQTTA